MKNFRPNPCTIEATGKNLKTATLSVAELTELNIRRIQDLGFGIQDPGFRIIYEVAHGWEKVKLKTPFLRWGHLAKKR